MITTFQTSGEIAGIAKWSCALSIPTSRPLRPSRITIGNSTRLRPDGQVVERRDPSMKRGMITPARSMNSTVMTLSTARISPNSAAASWNASLRCLCSSSSVKTGTKAAQSAESANRLRTRFGTWNAAVNADIGAAGAEVARGHDLADEACDARQAGGHGEDRRVHGRAPGLAVWRRQAARYSTPPPRGVRGFLASWPTSRHRSSGISARCGSAPRTVSTRPRSRPTSAACRPPSPRVTTRPPTPSTAASCS